MIVRRILSAADFSAMIEPLVLTDPVGFSILSVSLGRVLRAEVTDPDVVWWVAEDAYEHVVAAGQHLVPYPVGLHGIRDEIADRLAGPLADLLLHLRRDPPGVSGPRRAVLAFAEIWSARTGREFRTSRELARWVLDRLVPPTDVPGLSRPPREDEVQLVQGWVEEFTLEAASPAPPPADWAERRLGEGTLLVWEVADQPVALAGRTAVEAGVSRVGPVWTPGSLRGRGYGSAITAAATRAALDAGASAVCLYTDLANPVSNAIYAQLGYRPVGEEVEGVFLSPDVS